MGNTGMSVELFEVNWKKGEVSGQILMQLACYDDGDACVRFWTVSPKAKIHEIRKSSEDVVRKKAQDWLKNMFGDTRCVPVDLSKYSIDWD
jgi:hypothetical protein